MLAPSPVVDDVMLDGREAQFAKRSIEREATCAAIDIALGCTDLTTPGADFIKTSTKNRDIRHPSHRARHGGGDSRFRTANTAQRELNVAGGTRTTKQALA